MISFCLTASPQVASKSRTSRYLSLLTAILALVVVTIVECKARLTAGRNRGAIMADTQAMERFQAPNYPRFLNQLLPCTTRSWVKIMSLQVTTAIIIQHVQSQRGLRQGNRNVARRYTKSGQRSPEETTLPEIDQNVEAHHRVVVQSIA